MLMICCKSWFSEGRRLDVTGGATYVCKSRAVDVETKDGQCGCGFKNVLTIALFVQSVSRKIDGGLVWKRKIVI